jgi:hypothetical protein
MSKDNPFSRFWKKKADHLWSQAVEQAGRCAYCGSMVNLQARLISDNYSYHPDATGMSSKAAYEELSLSCSLS